MTECGFQDYVIKDIAASTLLSFGSLNWKDSAACHGGAHRTLERGPRGEERKPPANNQPRLDSRVSGPPAPASLRATTAQVMRHPAPELLR